MSKIVAQYIKDTQYDSKCFKVLKFDNEDHELQSVLKSYNESIYVYIKNKHFFLTIYKSSFFSFYLRSDFTR